jgi:hypothetical protein
MSRFRHIIVFLAWSFVASAPFANAQQTNPESVSPPPWRIIGQDEHTASSGCIGHPATALCAVETLLACFQWARPELCRMVDDGIEQYASVFTDPSDPTKYLAYRVVLERSVPNGVGAETEIFIDQQEMASGQVIGPSAGTSSGFKLRRQPDGMWKIVGWDDLPTEQN